MSTGNISKGKNSRVYILIIIYFLAPLMTVTALTYDVATYTTKISKPYRTVREYTYIMNVGENKVIQNGKTGVDVSYHEKRSILGFTFSNSVKNIEVEEAPINEIIEVGTGVIPEEVVNLPEPFSVYIGGYAWISAGTRPFSKCSITVNYLSGPSHAQGLYPKTASGAGEVRWDWFIGTNTTPGSWPVDVTCSSDGKTKTNNTFIYVRH